MKVEEYVFGKIVIRGKAYTSDVIVFPERIVCDWWRHEGHSVCLEDLSEVLAFKPELFVMGCGYHGALNVPDDLISELKFRGIDAKSFPSPEAVAFYNRLSNRTRTVFGIHLTC